MAVITQIQFRRGTAAQWSSTNPVLSSGELGYETDTGNFKIGNGTTAWNSLSVLNGITASTTATFTNKTINLANNTLTGTLAEFNTACSNADFVSIAGTETLTNKTLTTPVITLDTTSSTTQGRIAWDQTNRQIDIGDGTVVRTFTADDATGTLTNKTINGANNTLTVRLANDVSGTLPVANGGTGITSLGSGIATWLGTPTSANLAAALTDETGTGANVFANAPTLTGTVVASGDINLSAAGATGLQKDFNILNLMGCL